MTLIEQLRARDEGRCIYCGSRAEDKDACGYHDGERCRTCPDCAEPLRLCECDDG